METERKGRSCENIDIVCENAETCRDQDAPNVERILNLGVGAREGQILIFLEVTCRPDPDGLS